MYEVLNAISTIVPQQRVFLKSNLLDDMYSICPLKKKIPGSSIISRRFTIYTLRCEVKEENKLQWKVTCYLWGFSWHKLQFPIRAISPSQGVSHPWWSLRVRAWVSSWHKKKAPPWSHVTFLSECLIPLVLSLGFYPSCHYLCSRWSLGSVLT